MNIADFRDQHPEYADIPLDVLADAMHKKFYADMPRDEFMSRVGVSEKSTTARGTRGESKPRQIPGRSLLQGAMDPINAGAQMLERVLPDAAVERVNQFNNWLVEQGVPLEPLDERGLQGNLEDLERAYQESRQNPGQMDIGRVIGNIGAMAMGGAALAPARAATAGGRLAQGTAGGALGGALAAPVVGGDPDAFWQEKGQQAAIGAAAGGAVGGLVEGAAGLGRQVTRPNVQAMRDIGVTPTIGQTLGGVADDFEQKAVSLPVVGDMVRNQRQRTFQEFDTGFINEAIAPLGKTVTKTGREAIDEANQLVNDAYDYSRSLVDKIEVDQIAAERMMAIDADMRAAPEDMARAFDRYVRERLIPRGQGGAFATVDFKRIDSELGKRIASSDGELREAFAELQKTLRETAARQSPEYAEAQARADAAFARMVRANTAMNASAKTDYFTPGQAATAARQADRSAGKRSSAGGQALMQDLALSGEDVLGATVPNSGTAERIAQMAAIGGGGYGAGTGAIPMGAVGAYAALGGLYLTPVQKAIASAMIKAGAPLSEIFASLGLGAAAGAGSQMPADGDEVLRALEELDGVR